MYILGRGFDTFKGVYVGDIYEDIDDDEEEDDEEQHVPKVQNKVNKIHSDNKKTVKKQKKVRETGEA